jgi:amidohydrolase
VYDYLSEARVLFNYTRGLRRDFHRHPEIGFNEVRTAGIVARELEDLGLKVTTGIAKTGVTALLEMERPGPVILLRFDMDALPVQEETGVDYSSETPGVMHACGHDGHIAIGLSVARILYNHRQELDGIVKFVFQPAEEGLGGAEGMIKEGVLKDPKPDLALALHLWNEKPVGWLGIRSGPVMSASEIFRMRIIGRGGHGAAPHLAIDPVYASAQIINALQSIVSRNVPPLQSAVVSVTTIHTGDAFNVIPYFAEMQGTIRTFDPTVRERVLSRFRQIVEGIAEAMECQVELNLQSITPAVINDPQITDVIWQAAKQVLPGSQLDDDFSTMGSEDFAFMTREIPGCYFFIGSANPEMGLNASHHHPKFNFDEDALPRGVALITAAAVQFMRQQ